MIFFRGELLPHEDVRFITGDLSFGRLDGYEEIWKAKTVLIHEKFDRK